MTAIREEPSTVNASVPGVGTSWGWLHEESAARRLAEEAVGRALEGGASYVDARLVELEEERLYWNLNGDPDLRREHTVGIGVRVLLHGKWGFASRSMDADGFHLEAAATALVMADASPAGDAAMWSALPARSGHFATPLTTDPFTVPMREKQDLLDTLLDVARREPEIVAAVAGLNAKRQRRFFASSEGSWQVQELVECGGLYQAWAFLDGELQRRSYPNSFHGNTGGSGWEYVMGLQLETEAPRVVDEARALVRAPRCPAGTADVIIGPAMVALQIHESCGHALELDRILGDEAGFAGTSFIGPDARGRLRYGSGAVNVVADPTVMGARGSFGFDDEGQPARREMLIQEGVVRNFLSSRETAARQGLESTSAMRADGWQYMPLCFSTHVALLPGTGTLVELMERMGDGYYLDMDRSWSIDEQRLNFQFGTEVAYEVRKGVRGRLLRNASYGGITPEFWGSVEQVAGPEEFRVFGLPCGKGEPKQWGFVSHGAAPMLVRGVRMGVAG